MASPGFVASRGKDWNYVMGHSWWTSGLDGAAARWLIVLWLMQYWSKELWVVDICIGWSRRLHNTWIVGSQNWKSRGGGHVPQCPIAGDATEGSNDIAQTLSYSIAATTRFSPEIKGCQKQMAPSYLPTIRSGWSLPCKHSPDGAIKVR